MVRRLWCVCPPDKRQRIIAADRTILVLTLVLFVLITSTFLWGLRDVHGFYSGDMGVRLWQIRAWMESGWRSAALPMAVSYTGWKEPFTPLISPFFWSDEAGRVYTVYMTPFVAISGRFFERLGHLGFYLIPWMSGVAGLLILYVLGRRIGFRRPGLAVAVLGLTSPWLFYSITFWEHTLAAALAWAGMGVGFHRPRLMRSLLTGILLGLASAIRTEILLFALCWLFLFEERRNALQLWIAVGTTVLVAVMWPSLFQFRWTGQWLPARWLANTHSGWEEGSNLQVNPSYLSVDRLSETVRQVSAVARSPTPVGPALMVCYVVQVTNLLYLHRHRAERVERMVMWTAGATVGLIPLALLWTPESVADDLPISFPVLLLLPAWMRWHLRKESPRPVRTILKSVGLFIVLVLLGAPNDGGLQWGPRYLLVVLGPLALVVAEWVDRLEVVQDRGWRGLVLATLVLGLAVQAVGMYTLWTHRCDSVIAEAALSGEEIIVTNVWWLPYQFLPHSLPDRMALLVESRADLDSVVEHLRREGVEWITYVTLADEADPWPEADVQKGALSSVGRSLMMKWMVWLSLPTSF